MPQRAPRAHVERMDPAVALVEAYLQMNGYFTVVEYPLIETRRGESRALTDLDVLAFRFPNAGCATPGHGRRAHGPVTFEPDPALGVDPSLPDMIVGEVKEGLARFNPAARDPLVLAGALARFGCCPPDAAGDTARKLLATGRASTPSGHVVRMVAFGGHTESGGDTWHAVPLAHVVAFVRHELRARWPELRHAELKHPALSLLALLEKLGPDAA